MKKIIVLIALALTSVSQAYALPLAPTDAKSAAALALRLPAVNAAYNFEGIVKLDNCSGSIIRLKNSVDTDPALVLTNGHCLANVFGGGMPKPGVVITNKIVSRKFWLKDPVSAADLGVVTSTKIVYATMTNTDMTIYALKETFGEIEKKFNIRALVLGDHYPAVGDSINIISGYWKRGYSCKIDAIIPALEEAGWTMVESIRYSRPGCETIGGTSGSPIINTETNEVVGVNNTGSEDGAMCTMNNPCEIDADGVKTAHKGFSYGQQTHWLYACLNGPTSVDLDQAGCKLAK